MTREKALCITVAVIELTLMCIVFAFIANVQLNNPKARRTELYTYYEAALDEQIE